MIRSIPYLHRARHYIYRIRYLLLLLVFCLFLSDVAVAVDDELGNYEMLQLFGEIIDRVEEQYVSEIDRKKFLEDAIQGALRGLDPHTVLLNADSYGSLNDSTIGKIGGVGMEVYEAEGGGVKVVAPMRDSPAEKADIRPNDVIIAVDGVSILDMTLPEAIKIMRGEEGTSVEFVIRRDGKKIKKVVVREIIKVSPVVYWMEDKVGYLRLSNFNSNADESIKDAIKELQGSNSDIEGYILDLRNNPGGLLEQALKVADLFMEYGEIVSVRSERENNNTDAVRFQASKGDIINGSPLVIMIDGGSASASEIVAGALRDQERAILLGQISYGKGSVQSILDVRTSMGSEDTSYWLKLTIQKYFTPSGVSIDGRGISPDIKVLDDGSVKPLDGYISNRFPDDVQLSYALREAKRLYELDRALQGGETDRSDVIIERGG